MQNLLFHHLMFWPSRCHTWRRSNRKVTWCLGRMGPVPRRSTSRASWARLRSPVPSPRPPCRRPSPLRSTSARRPRRGLIRRAVRASPLRSLGPVGPARIPRSLSSIYASLYVRAGRSGPPLRPPTFGCDHLRGGPSQLVGPAFETRSTAEQWGLFRAV